MKVKAYLSKPKTADGKLIDKPRKVNLYCRQKGIKQLIIPTDIFIRPKEFLSKALNPEKTRLNLLIQQVENDVSLLKLSGEPAEQIREFLNRKFNLKISSDVTLIDAVKTVMLSKSARNQRHYNHLISSISRYQKHLNGTTLLLHSFGKNDFTDYKNYLLNTLSSSTAKILLQLLKHVLMSEKAKLFDANDFKIRFDVDEKPVFRLLMNELKTFATIPLPPKLDNSRKLFMLSYYTLQRHSDVVKFEVDANNVWTFSQQKTNEKLSIPISSDVVQMTKTIKPESYQQTEKNVRQIAMLCNFERQIAVTKRTPDGIKQTTYRPLKELLTFHTARKSGASMLFIDKKQPASIVMAMSGHKTLSSFFIYIGKNEGIAPETVNLLSLNDL